MRDKKSIRTTVSSDNEEKPKTSLIPSQSFIKPQQHTASYPSSDAKLPSSPTFPKNFFENRPISSNSHLYKDQYSK